MIGPVERFAYVLSQGTRVSWFFAQARLAVRLERRRAPAVPRPSRGYPALGAILAALRRLIAADLANIEAGRYRLPHDLASPPGRVLADATRFFRDLPAVQRRRRKGIAQEVVEAPPPGSERLPRYYRQNFHFQTDGYLSDRSARLYDHQVEVLFYGSADAMRRQALVPIGDYLATRAQSATRMIDLGTGTGRFLTFVKDNFPRLPVLGIDLSRPYLVAAGRATEPWRRATHLVQAAAESLPVPTGSVDLVTAVYLFHELPAAVRARVAGEIARVLKPGGRLVLVDSLQLGDVPAFDGLLELFPEAFHEPYYAGYIRQNLPAVFMEAGLVTRSSELAFLSKVIVAEKPAE
ncbi:MAG: methyltransferase domain-containing protein [Azospirillum sp.]|nr:methyltransferase domain-containing protein [Azospirillum sp.]